MKIKPLFLLLGIFLFSCSMEPDKKCELDKEAIAIEVKAVMNDYKEAILAKDANGIVKHYLDAPEFRFYNGSKFMNYQEQSDHVRKLVTSADYEGDVFADIQFLVLGKSKVVAYSELDYSFSDTTGIQVGVSGGVSYFLVKKDDKWQIIHAISAHELKE